MSPEGPSEQGDAFRVRLQELKEQGSAILLVGEVPSNVRDRACERLLGEAETLPRHRLLVFTNGRGGIESRLRAHDPGRGSTEVITAAVTRSTATGSRVDADVPVRELDPDSLRDLGGAISAWVDETEESQGTLAHGELRLCVNSLSPLLEVHGERPVFEFVVVTAARVRAVAGMAHFHLPVASDADVAKLIAPAVDAVIELRTDDGEPQQRWHLVDEDLQSRWLPL
ncbi:hypothetical protein BRC81_15870 [Halobacteriales archaeon QS_1_68_20]|nr:MAG: hypothetical protein BRC81_15870 [Halobacteriales archaeon QS_1_68_20]